MPHGSWQLDEEDDKRQYAATTSGIPDIDDEDEELEAMASADHIEQKAEHEDVFKGEAPLPAYADEEDLEDKPELLPGGRVPYKYSEYQAAVEQGGLKGPLMQRYEFDETWATLPINRDEDTEDDRAYRTHIYERNQREEYLPDREEWQADRNRANERTRLLDAEPRREAPSWFDENAAHLKIIAACVSGVLGFLSTLAFFFGIGYTQGESAYWQFLLILPITCFATPAMAFICVSGFGANEDTRYGAAAAGCGVGFFLSIIAVVGVLVGVQAQLQVMESNRIIAGGQDADLCPNSDPAAETRPAALWAPGSHYAKEIPGTYSWYESSKDDTEYYCLTVAPVMAPSKAQQQKLHGSASQFGEKACVAPDAGPTEVAFWAFYSEQGDWDGDCDQSYVNNIWRNGGIIKDESNIVVMDGHGDFGGYSGDDLKDMLDSAKKDFLKKYGVGSHYKPKPGFGPFTFTDHPNSKYVMMTDNPMADAKAAQDAPYYYFGYMIGIVLLIIFCVIFQTAAH